MSLPGTDTKPTKEAVAFFWRDDSGKFSAVKRPPADPNLPNVWGLPSGSPATDETDEAAVIRSGHDKLDVEVEIIRYVGEDWRDRGEYILHLKEYEVRLITGVPTVPQADTSITQYVDFKMSDDPKIFMEAAKKGSLCSRIFLREAGLWSPEPSFKK
jgi:ADP-ribose pyrophosphatase YjhB (NUDIX family)